MRYRIAPWVCRQHENNPALPDLSYDKVGEICKKLPSSEEIDLTDASELTDYPLVDSGTEYFLTGDENYVIEAEPPGTHGRRYYRVVAIRGVPW